MRCKHCGEDITRHPASHDHREPCEVEDLEGDALTICAYPGPSAESDAAEGFIERYASDLEADGGDVYHMRVRKVGAEEWKYFKVGVEVELSFTATADDDGETAASFAEAFVEIPWGEAVTS